MEYTRAGREPQPGAVLDVSYLVMNFSHSNGPNIVVLFDTSSWSLLTRVESWGWALSWFLGYYSCSVHKWKRLTRVAALSTTVWGSISLPTCKMPGCERKCFVESNGAVLTFVEKRMRWSSKAIHNQLALKYRLAKCSAVRENAL